MANYCEKNVETCIQKNKSFEQNICDGLYFFAAVVAFPVLDDRGRALLAVCVSEF